MKTRLVTLSILALAGASTAAAQTVPATPTQQVQPEAPSPSAEPPVLYQEPPVPLQPYAAPPGAGLPAAQPPVWRPRPYVTPQPQLPPPQPRVYGNAAAPVSLGVGGALVWRNEDHARFGNDDFVGAVNVFASYDVWASRGFVLAGGLDFRHDERARTSLGELKDNLLTADLTGRLRAASWLWPHVRAGVGLAVTQVELHDDRASIELDDRDVGVAGSFGAGFTVRTPTRALETHRGKLASLSLGILIEGGYTVAKDATLTPEPARGGDVRRASPASFSAERSAAYLRIMAVTRF